MGSHQRRTVRRALSRADRAQQISKRIAAILNSLNYYYFNGSKDKQRPKHPARPGQTD